jgi:hypothetical protein
MPQCTPSTTIRKKEKKRKKKKREERQTTTKTQMHVFCKPGTIQLCMTLSSPSLACSINLMTDYSYTNFSTTVGNPRNTQNQTLQNQRAKSPSLCSRLAAQHNSGEDAMLEVFATIVEVPRQTQHSPLPPATRVQQVKAAQ